MDLRPEQRRQLLDPESQRSHILTQLNVFISYRRANCCQRLVLLICFTLMLFGLMAILGMTMCMVRFGGQPNMSLGRCWQWMWLWR